MRDRRIGQQALEVRLHRGDQRGVDDADDGQHDNRRRTGFHGKREQRQAEPDKAVQTHLQRDQHNRPAGRRFGVRIGHPGMEREHRSFDAEREKEADKQQNVGDLTARKQPGDRADVLLQRRQVKRRRAAQKVQSHDGDQHDHRAGHRVQEELDGRIDAPLAAPDADDEIHRDQHPFPEQVVQHQVQGQKDAQHGGLHHQHPSVELPAAGVDLLKRDADREREDHGRHQHHQQRDAVHAEKVVDVERRYPRGHVHKLELRPVRRVLRVSEQRDSQRRQRSRQRDRFDRLCVVLRDQPDHQRKQRRQEHQPGQQPPKTCHCFCHLIKSLLMHISCRAGSDIN